jgi:nucleoside-diphosphate kinase
MNNTSLIIVMGSIALVLLLALYFIRQRGVFGRAHGKERTFAMIKPDAIEAKNSGKIIDLIEHNGFTIVGMEKRTLTKDQAQEFYAVHKARPFFNELVNFVTSGPVIVMALEKEHAIKAWRDLMGATDPLKAAEGTLRKQFGKNIGSNAVHGSDAPETAHTELALFFPTLP